MVLIAELDLGSVAERPVGSLTFGARKRVELARALAGEPKLLLLDEPLAGLSQAERQTVRALLDAIPRDVTIVMIEHDMDFLFSLADQVSVIHWGQVIAQGTPAELYAARIWR